MRVLLKYIILILPAGVFFILYNYVLDLLFYKLDYGSTEGVPNGLVYTGYFILMYAPFLLLFLIVYNLIVDEVLDLKQQRSLRYLMAFGIGLLTGLAVGRYGASYYIGYLRLLKNVLLFGLLLISLELTKDFFERLRTRN